MTKKYWVFWHRSCPRSYAAKTDNNSDSGQELLLGIVAKTESNKFSDSATTQRYQLENGANWAWTYAAEKA